MDTIVVVVEELTLNVKEPPDVISPAGTLIKKGRKSVAVPMGKNPVTEPSAIAGVLK